MEIFGFGFGFENVINITNKVARILILKFFTIGKSQKSLQPNNWPEILKDFLIEYGTPVKQF